MTSITYPFKFASLVMLESNVVTEDPVGEAVREWVRDDSSEASFVVLKDVAEELKR